MRLAKESLSKSSDSDNSILGREDGELSPSPPRKMKKKEERKRNKESEEIGKKLSSNALRDSGK